MQILLKLFAILFTLTLITSCSEKPRYASKPSKLKASNQAANTSQQIEIDESKGPELSLTANKFDFGTIGIGGASKLTVVIKNGGRTDIKISSFVTTGSSAFQYTVGKLPKTLKPNQTMPFDVLFKPKSIGVFEGSVRISSKNSANLVTLNVRGAGGGALLSLSQSKMEFGTYRLGNLIAYARLVTLKNSGSQKLVVKKYEVTPPTPAFYTTLAFPLTLAPGQTKVASIIFFPNPKVEAKYSSSLKFVSNSTVTPKIALSGEISSAKLVTDPKTIAFGTVNQNAKPIEKTFKVSNPGRLPLSITASNISNNSNLKEFSLSPSGPLTIPAGGFALYSLKFTPKQAGKKSHTVSFTSNASKTSSVKVSANVVGSKLSLSRTNISFGLGKPNTTITENLTAVNEGTLPVQIKNIAIVGAGSSAFSYKFEGSPKLPAGAARNMTVSFAPKTEGDFSAELRVESDASSGPAKVILSGSSVASTTMSGPSSVSFEPTFARESIKRVIQISNDGPGKLILSSVLLKGENANSFVVTDYPRDAIQAGEKALIAIEYLTSEPGTDVTTLEIKSNATNKVLNVSLDARTIAAPTLPPDPKVVAPALPEKGEVDFYASNKFLLEGTNKIQFDADISKMKADQAGMIQGKILDTDDEALPGAKITILNHPEFGYTLSRENGEYNLLVNANYNLTVSVERMGYLASQRSVLTTQGRTAAVPDIYLTKQSSVVNSLSFSGQTQMQAAVGETSSDADGVRTPVLLVPAGTNASMIMPNGNKQPLGNISLSVSEFTKGQNGLKAMPAVLPPTSAYTFAADFSIAEAKAAGSKLVEFSKPIYSYVDNFIDMPTGSIVPSGYYDYAKGYWVPSEDGQVIEILNVVEGKARVDINGDGAAEDDVSIRYQAAHSEKNVKLAPGLTWSFIDPLPLKAVSIMGAFNAMSRMKISGTNAAVTKNLKIGISLSSAESLSTVTAKLISPSGLEILLKPNQGTNLYFERFATLYPDQTASAQNLATLQGQALNGTWELRVTSNGYRAPIINEWSMIQADAGISCGNYNPDSDKFRLTPKADGIIASWDGVQSTDAYVLVRNASAAAAINFAKGHTPIVGESVGANQVVYVGSNSQYYDRSVPANKIISYTLYTIDNYLSTLKGMTEAELLTLGKLYPDASNKKLWRMPLKHFSTYDFNFPNNLAEGAEPPKEPLDQSKGEEKQCKKRGCVISVETQTLGEILPIQGTPYNLTYSTMKSKGRTKDYAIVTQLSDSTLHNDVISIGLTISVAGQVFKKEFAPEKNLSFEYIWDGRDGYGRLINGRQIADVQVDYVYRSKYFVVKSSTGSTFGQAGGTVGQAQTTLEGRDLTSRTLSTRWQRTVGTPLMASNAGNWDIDVHHRFDFKSSTLIKGDGSRQKLRDSKFSPILKKPFFPGDTNSYIQGVTLDAEGNYYVTLVNPPKLIKLGVDGVQTTILSSELSNGPAPSDEGGPAINYPISELSGFVFHKLHRSLLASAGSKLMEIDSNGVIRRIAGNGGTQCSPNFTGKAVDLSFGSIARINVNSQGDVFFTGCDSKMLFRLKRDGEVEKVAGNLDGPVATVFDQPANSLNFGSIQMVTIAPNDEIYLTAGYVDRIIGISTNGIARVVAGNGIRGYTNDGGLAKNAQIANVSEMVVDLSGRLWICDQDGQKLRVIDTNGIITTRIFNDTENNFYNIFYLNVTAKNELVLTKGFDTILKLSEDGIQRNSDGSVLVVDEEGAIAHKFDAKGRHLATFDTLQGTEILRFSYNVDGTLSEIQDRDGLKTRFNRDSSGLVYSIVSPYSETTHLTYDSNDQLTTVTDPANRQRRFDYDERGLISRITDAKGNESEYIYDSMGLLLSDEDAAGFKQTMSRKAGIEHNEVNHATPMGRISTYTSRVDSNGVFTRVQIASDGTQTRSVETASHDMRVDDASGMISKTFVQQDSRFGYSASIPLSASSTTPDGVIAKADYARTVTLSSPTDFMSLTKLKDDVILSGVGTFTSTYDRVLRSRTSQTPSGYVSKETYNTLGRPVKLEMSGITPVEIAYDTDGRMVSSTQGSRMSNMSYNSLGRVSSATNALGQSSFYTYDTAGRVIQVQKPDGRLLKYSYDQNDNLISVVLPRNQTHSYSFDVLDQMVLNTDPSLSGVNDEWRFTYNGDRQANKNTFPNGENFQYGYDSSGRLTQIATARGNFHYGYDAVTGQLISAKTPENNLLNYDWDGPLLKSSNWSGEITGSIAMSYGDQMRLTAETVQGSVDVTYSYRPEGSLKTAGPLNLSYNSSNGLLTDSTLYNSNERFTYNAFGEIATRSVTMDSTTLYNESLTRDALGRIAGLTRNINGESETISYTYDVSGRLASVAKVGAATENFVYDDNDNRILDTDTLYDAQDRLTRNKDWTFSYNARGYLARKTSRTGTAVVNYVYDNLGQLRTVTDNAGLNLSYIYDAQGRQIGRVKNGVLSRGLIYRDQLRPAAELNSNGSLKSVFVYGSRGHVPEYMDRGGDVYRFVTDHLGSVRLVVNLATGEVVQTISYDSWGKVINDTNPGFQPFGYAGGIYDHETGLVRFGVRDYDGRIGRWLDKDPIRFAGGMNFYVYVGNDPINFIDTNGLAGTLIFTGTAIEITDSSGNGPNQSFSANNRTNRPNADGYIPEGNGPIPPGIYPVGPLIPTNQGPNDSLGDKGFLPIKFPTPPPGHYIGPQMPRTGVGIHAGRLNRGAGKWGTNGCIRTTPEGMDAIRRIRPDKLIVPGPFVLSGGL